MKVSIRGATVFALVAVLAVAAFGQVVGTPIIPPEWLLGAVAAGGVPFAGGIGEMDVDLGKELKALLDKQERAWEEHKKTNNELLAAKADGKAVSDLEAKLEKIGHDLDTISDVKSQFDALVAKLNRPGGDATKQAQDFATEVKSFNLAMASDYQARGKASPAELSGEAYAAYKSAFFSMARGIPLDHLSTDERKALSAGSDPDGGYLLPASTVGRMVSRIYERSVIRRLANVQTISTDSLEGIVDNDESDAGWVSEMGSRTDTDTPTVGKYRLEVHEMYAQPKVTQKLIDDAATNVEQWLANKTADKFARVEGAAYMTGDGVGKPRGLFSYETLTTGDDTRAWGKFQHVISGANGAFHTTKFDPLHDLIGSMKDEYLARAQWLMRREVRTAARKLKEATSDRYLWEPSMVAGQPERLMGYPVNVDQYVPALQTGSLSLAFGDFAEAFTIVDRMGIRTLRDPFTAKPYIRFYSTRRTGSGAINFEAVKFLKFTA